MSESRTSFGLISMVESTRVVLPLKEVRCVFSVEGGVAEVAVTQVFLQEHKEPLDCLYQFPLPADASVYACEAFINDRVIRAKVEEREAARQLAEQKKAEGYRTMMVEAERENLFSLSLGNLQPEDLVEVRLAYIQPLRRLAGSLALEIPFCPGVRYIPGCPLLRSNRGKGVADDTDQVPDASRISPVRIDKSHPDAAFVDLEGTIEAGYALPGSVQSPSHNITSSLEKGLLRMTLNDKADVPDRDFALRWREKPASKSTPRAWIHREGKERYALLEIRAPEADAQSAEAPQDIYFLVDRSGSMEGEKWHKAVEALQSCVAVLARQDRVMVTLFQSTFQDFAEAPMPPAEMLTDAAFEHLAKRGTEGGTEMGPALSHVLELISKHSPHRRTNLVLITDAQVGNEREILGILKQAPQLAVHCFGIDNALNDALLQALTRQQGGSFHSLNPRDDIRDIVTNLGRTLRQPVLLDLELSEGWETADYRIPNLYAGQVHYAAARRRGASALSLTARNPAGKPVVIRFEAAESKSAAPYLHWCKTRIRRLLAENERSGKAIRLSKAANLICELTAFVAWDAKEQVAVATHELVQPGMLQAMHNTTMCCRLRAPAAFPESRPPVDALFSMKPQAAMPPISLQSSEQEVESWMVRLLRLCDQIHQPELRRQVVAIIRKAFRSVAGTGPRHRFELEVLADRLERLVVDLNQLQSELETLRPTLGGTHPGAPSRPATALSAVVGLARRLATGKSGSGLRPNTEAALHPEPGPVLTRPREMVDHSATALSRRSRIESEITDRVREFATQASRALNP